MNVQAAKATRIPTTAVTSLIVDAMGKAGVSKDDAGKIAALMLEADLIGADAHGVFRLMQYVQRLKLGSTNPRPNITVNRTAPATALVDGDNGMMQAAREVLNKAEEVITANQEALHQAIADIAAFSASLARNADNVDSIMDKRHVRLDRGQQHN